MSITDGALSLTLRMQRVDHLSAFVESESVSGVYEVIDTVDE